MISSINIMKISAGKSMNIAYKLTSSAIHTENNWFSQAPVIKYDKHVIPLGSSPSIIAKYLQDQKFTSIDLKNILFIYASIADTVNTEQLRTAIDFIKIEMNVCSYNKLEKKYKRLLCDYQKSQEQCNHLSAVLDHICTNGSTKFKPMVIDDII